MSRLNARQRRRSSPIALRQPLAVRRPLIIPNPTQSRQPLPEFLRDRRRQPSMHIFQPASQRIPPRRFMQCQQRLPFFSWRTGIGIEQQIRFRRQPQQGSAGNSLPALFPSQNQLGQKQRVAQIRNRISESLPRMNRPQRLQVALLIRSNLHLADYQLPTTDNFPLKSSPPR